MTKTKRTIQVKRKTASPSNRSVVVILATEKPITYLDADGEEFDEVLLMSGIKYRANKRKIPIVDAGDTSSIRNVLGSVRNLRVENHHLVGNAYFARDITSQDAYQKLLDGHVSDFEIVTTNKVGYSIHGGETKRFQGITYEGPTDIVTGWVPTFAALVVESKNTETGVKTKAMAKPKAKARTASKFLTAKMRSRLIGRGMPRAITKTGPALDWLIKRQKIKQN